MARRCKNCDPNKYIDGMAWRGANGYDFAKIYSYNDVGQPSDLGILANVSDMVDAYNPIFTSNSSIGLAKVENEQAYIRGIDRSAGFWFIWDFTKGMTAFGTPGNTVSTPYINNFHIDYTNISPNISKYDGDGNLIGLIQADYVKNSGSRDIIITTKTNDGIGINEHNLYTQENPNLGLCFDQNGVGYYTSPESNLIYKFNKNGSPYVLAGYGSVGTGIGSTYVRSDNLTWTSSASSFNKPRSICINTGNNTIYVADTENHRIVRITQTTQTIGNISYFRSDTFNFAGYSERSGSIDGIGTAARFNSPNGIIIDRSGNNLYIADTNNHTIRRIALSGSQRTVTTIAGRPQEFGTGDSINGTGANFYFPKSLAIANETGLYVADSNHTIRVIDLNPSLNFPVQTIAGAAGQPGYIDHTGSNARFNGPVSLFPESGNLLSINQTGMFIADYRNNVIRKLNLNTKEVVTYAGGGSQNRRTNKYGTYTQNGNTITLTMNGHGYLNDRTRNDIGTRIYLNFRTGNSRSGYYQILSIIDGNRFTVGSTISQITSGEAFISSLRSSYLNRPGVIAEDFANNLYAIDFSTSPTVNYLKKISNNNLQFINITYSQPINQTYAEFTLNNHRLSSGDFIYIRTKTGTNTFGEGEYIVTVINSNTFRITVTKQNVLGSGLAEIITVLYITPGTLNAQGQSNFGLLNYLVKDANSSLYFDVTNGNVTSNYFQIQSILDKYSFTIKDTTAALNDILNGKARLNFATRVSTNSLPSSYSYNGFNIFKDSSNPTINPTDPLIFNTAQPISNISYLTKKQILKIGYYTGLVTATALNNVKALNSQQTTTIVVKDSLNNDPILVTSSPVLIAFKGQLAYYKFETNIQNGSWNIEFSQSVKDILTALGLVYDDVTKTISGLVSDSIQDDVKGEILEFTVFNSDKDYGQTVKFNLMVVSGEQSSKSALLPKPVAKVPSITIRRTLNYERSNDIDINLSDYFTNMDGRDASERKYYNISCQPFSSTSFLNGLTFNTSSSKLVGRFSHAGRYIIKAAAANTQGKSDDIYIVFDILPYRYNDASTGNTFPLDIKLPVASFENIAQNTVSIKFRTYGDEIFEFKKITDEEAGYITNTSQGNGRPRATDNPDIYKKGRDMAEVRFRPGLNRTTESKFWMYIEDPTINILNANGTNPEVAINVEGDYSIGDGFVPFIDALGQTCYKPQANSFGPVSTPIYQDLNLLATSLIKTDFSSNPAENLPNISLLVGENAVNIEHQVYFFTAGGGGSLTTVGNIATQKLSKSGLLKYPLGIPNGRGTYLFYVKLADTCSFNNEIRSGNYNYTPIALYIGTYTPRAGDVYSCAYERRCFPKNTKVFTPNGWKNIQDFKIGDEIYAYDDDENLKISRVFETIDHNLVPDEIYKVILENGQILRTNLDHPFFIESGKYLTLEELKPGDYVVSFEKKRIKILDIIYDCEEPVYNLEVEKYHNYIAEGIFVHNMGGVTVSRYTKPGDIKYDPGGRGALGGWYIYEVGYRGYGTWRRKGTYTAYENVTLASSSVPGNCGTVISQVGAQRRIDGYGFRYSNSFLESKDIGITTLTNISLLDVLSEGPIEGITDYEIKPNQCDPETLATNPELCPQVGDIGWSKKGVQISRYPGQNSFIRSIYWNETPLADDTYSDGSKGSLNFDFIKLKFENGDKSPTHTKTQNLKNIDISEDLYTQKIGNGIPLENIYIFGENEDILATDAKIPKLLTVTKTIGQKLFGKRVFRDGTSRTYKKSYNIMTPDLYGIRFHIKISALSKTIVDLTIWESFDAAENNSQSGRIDRIGAYFNLKLKKINRGVNNEGQKVIPVTYEQNGKILDTWRLNCVGKILKGGFIETFEWLGLDQIADKNTIGWEVEIEPLHEESVDTNIQIECGADSVTEMYKDRLVFPHTASVLTTFDARYFQSIPQRYYDTRLLKVKIPSNYNPFSKSYEGTWDGTFQLGWTDNPAWCFYDMLTNNRFGLGKYVDSLYIDKWTLYDIGKYCDQLVSDGKGGLEPRFTCNLLISTREDAYKVLNDMASIFRAIVYYNAGLIFTSQDKPKEPIYLFNNSNVRNGEFTYNDTSKRVRRNVILIRYNNKDNFFKPAVKYVENRAGLIRFGIREMDMTAFGCTSEGQAERLGKWTLLSENLESEVVSFETSLPALYLKPGDVILVQDENRQNKILGGRTYDLTRNYAILDLKYDRITGYQNVISGCKFNVLTPAGNIELGTPSGNKAVDIYSQVAQSDNPTDLSIPLNSNGITTNVNQINEDLIRRKQIQTKDLGLNYNGGRFFDFISEETGINFSGYTRLNLSSSPLDDSQHTLLKNTVWTLEVDPNFYDYVNSPTVRSPSTSGLYPGAALEPYLDRTQKFRVLDIEEKEEYLYKITALQYSEEKFSLADNI